MKGRKNRIKEKIRSKVSLNGFDSVICYLASVKWWIEFSDVASALLVEKRIELSVDQTF